MTPLPSFALLASIVTCVITISSGRHYPNVYYATNKCSQSVQVDRDVRIKLTSNLRLNPQTNCSIKFYPKSGTELKATFLKYTMISSYVSETGDCRYESIQLYNAYGTSQLKNSIYCSRWKPQANFYLGSNGQFRLLTGTSSVIMPAEVDLLISEVSPKGFFFTSACPYNYFDCGNNYCVSNDVTCNGYDDCGNNADEIDGCVLSSGAIGGIVVSCIVFIVICVIISVVFYRVMRIRVAATNIQRF